MCTKLLAGLDAARLDSHNPRLDAAVPAPPLPDPRSAGASTPGRPLLSYPADSVPAAHGGRARPGPATPPAPVSRATQLPPRPASRST